MTDKPKQGTIQFRNGKCSIVVDEKGTTEDFGIDFVCNHMRKAVAQTKTYYGTFVRQLIFDLRAGGMNAIPNVRERLHLLYGDKRQGVNQLSRQWDGWLGQIWQFRNIKTGGGAKKSSYTENYEKIFAGVK